MSVKLCGPLWVDRERMEHSCEENEGHAGICVCSCGARSRETNKIIPFKPKPFYKRQRT